MKKNLLHLLLAFLLLLGLGTPVRATAPPATGRPLAEALNPDGTLRPGANGSFDARQFRMGTAPDGRPVFRPTGTMGAGDERWANGFGHPTGANAEVRVVVRAGNTVYIGGFFSVVGAAAANRVAKWDGTSWSNLGTGLTGNNSVVLALAVAPNGDLYAAGRFTQAGGVPANNIARWNGTAWSALSIGTANGVDGEVFALAVASTGEVYVGGALYSAGNTSVTNIARWNGTAWFALGTGANEGVNGRVTALAMSAAGEVYVGGIFGTAGSTPANNVAKWSGTAWRTVGTNAAIGGNVSALVVAGNGEVYVGGYFTVNGNTLASQVAKWNGTAWSSLSTVTSNGGNNAVSALAVAPNGDLYAGGYFYEAGGVPVRNVARWNGTVWDALPASPTTQVYGLAVASSGDLYVGGYFLEGGGQLSRHVARWNGTAWNNLGAGNGANSTINAIAVAANGDVYIGGTFTQVGSVQANYVAKWSGTTWSTLGAGPTNGVDGWVYALAVASNGDVYVGGDISQAGGVAVRYAAKWNGTAWSAMGATTTTRLSATVNALAVASNGEVYAGGEFIRAGSASIRGLAKWDGTAWVSVGLGAAASNLDGSVYALAIAGNGDLYVGGSFTSAGGATANRIARWNGTAWSSLGTGPANGIAGFVGTIHAIALAGNGDVYVGGDFSQAGGVSANFVAKWDGTAWSGLAAGLSGNLGPVATYARALAVAPNGDVYAGGVFNQSGTTAVNYVARWDGTAWSNLGTSVNSNVLAMRFGLNGKLYVGGVFTTTGDGRKAMSYFGIYDPAAPLATAAKAMPAAQLFPNPAHSTATLRLPTGAPRQPLTLTDALGRTVRRYPAPATAEAELDLRGLPAGTYVVRCGEYSQRLVVE